MNLLIEIKIKEKVFLANLSDPIDISIPLQPGVDNVNAWYSEPVTISPVRIGDFIGDVNEGGPVNTRNVTVNPHGNGTHTECVGHISKENITLNECLKTFHFLASLVTINPKKVGEDLVIDEQLLEGLNLKPEVALIIRTLPNDGSKLKRQYSGSNPTYLTKAAAEWIAAKKIQHLLIDTPSIDKEKDDGLVVAHHAFWKYPYETRKNATISELIYVNNDVPDGRYLLNIQTTSLENDASPSKPVLYKLSEK